MQESGSDKIIPKSYLPSLCLKSAVIFSAGVLVAVLIFYLSFPADPGTSYQETFRRLSLLKSEILRKTLLLYGGALCLIIAGVWYIALMYSHRAVGPLIRLGRVARQIGAGDFTETVILRQGDVVQPVAVELNEIAASFAGRVATLRKQADEVRAFLAGSVDMRAEKGDDVFYAELAEKIRQIEDNLHTLKI